MYRHDYRLHDNIMEIEIFPCLILEEVTKAEYPNDSIERSISNDEFRVNTIFDFFKYLIRGIMNIDPFHIISMSEDTTGCLTRKRKYIIMDFPFFFIDDSLFFCCF